MAIIIQEKSFIPCWQEMTAMTAMLDRMYVGITPKHDLDFVKKILKEVSKK